MKKIFLCLVAGWLLWSNVHAQKMYAGENLHHVAFPIGGIGAGMFCMEGTGAFSHVSLRHNPEMKNEPVMFAALSIKEMNNSARVLEGPVPMWKAFGPKGTDGGAGGKTYGLPRYASATFSSRFPFATVSLTDQYLPVTVSATAWSPFLPGDENVSSLPVGAVEYTFTNNADSALHCTFSFNAANFMTVNNKEGAADAITPLPGGYVLSQLSSADHPELRGQFAVFVNDSNVSVDHCWFRGGYWDPLSMAWKKIQQHDTSSIAPVAAGAPGASLYVPFILQPHEERTIRVMTAWYVPDSRLRTGGPVHEPSDSAVADLSVNLPSKFYKPWYSSRFNSVEQVAEYWRYLYNTIKQKTLLFTNSFYAMTLPPEVMDAVSANLTILKSPTVMRQYDGRFWAWEGCGDDFGSCQGTCTHVYNYAQALPHLFPAMERSVRETEYNESLDLKGHQLYRAALPIRPAAHYYYLPAADGQLGSIMRCYRDWRICGDSNWLRKLYPKIRLSMQYCINTWDPMHRGIIEEPHHNTYDIEFWGPEPMCTSIYLGALEAMVAMGDFLKQDVSLYQSLLVKGKAFMEAQLFNGEYFEQQVKWKELQAGDPAKYDSYSPEALLLLEKEGPKYQYGKGCLSDGVLGAWEAFVCGLPPVLDKGKVLSHLSSVYKYNYKTDVSLISNPQRPGFAMGREGGLLLCTWPRGGELSLPFIYSNEVWTGVEYATAANLIFAGRVAQGLDIVRTCRSRYDGRIRNPFDEVEAGHWYARAMSSYSLIQALTGVRYDAVDKTLYVDSKIGDFVSFLATDKGFGNVVYKNGKVEVKVVYGNIDVRRIVIAGK